MAPQRIFQSVWICLFFSIAVCLPARKSPADAGYHAGGSHRSRGGSGSSGGFSFGFGTGSVGRGGVFSGFGSGSSVSSSAAQDGGLSQMVADLMSLSPDRPLLQSHWSAPQVPLGMVATRPVYPSSLIVLTDSGYQRARDFRSDSKYTQEIFDNVPRPGAPQSPGSGSEGQKV